MSGVVEMVRQMICLATALLIGAALVAAALIGAAPAGPAPFRRCSRRRLLRCYVGWLRGELAQVFDRLLHRR